MKLAHARWGFAGILLTTLVGCGGPPMAVDGYKLWSNRWRQDAATLRARASFDLSCPAPDVTLRVIGTSYSPHAFGTSDVGFAKTVGALGCGRRATYVRLQLNDEWVMNGAARADTSGRNLAASD